MGDCSFSEDAINSMTDQLSDVATSITGAAPGQEGSFGSYFGGSFGDFNFLTCQPGSECYKKKHTKRLIKEWRRRDNQYTNAPIDLSRAEKNYYQYNRGEEGGDALYNSIIIDRFARSAKKFKANSIDMQQQFMADLSQALKQYQAQVIFQLQSAKLLETRKQENTALVKNINYYQKIVQTSERKVVYGNKNMDSLYVYRRLMIFIYYAAIVGFVVFGNFITDEMYKKISVWILLVIASIFPIILNMLIKWILIIGETISYWYSDPHVGYGRFQRYKDVYFNMGSPFDEPPPAKPMSSINTSGMPSSLSAAISPTLSAFGAA
jgi:hypothetical protein